MLHSPVRLREDYQAESRVCRQGSKLMRMVSWCQAPRFRAKALRVNPKGLWVNRKGFRGKLKGFRVNPKGFRVKGFLDSPLHRNPPLHRVRCRARPAPR